MDQGCRCGWTLLGSQQAAVQVAASLCSQLEAGLGKDLPPSPQPVSRVCFPVAMGPGAQLLACGLLDVILIF